MGVEFPPAVVYQDGDDKLGWQRAVTGRKRMRGRVRFVSALPNPDVEPMDAIRFGIEDNLKQGERLSRDDRRFNVKRVLQEARHDRSGRRGVVPGSAYDRGENIAHLSNLDR